MRSIKKRGFACIKRMACILIIPALIFPLALHAQLSGIHSTGYSTKNGLSNPVINAITKDDDGFLWIATAEGLNRFDGDRFTVLLRQNDKTSLTDNGLSSLKYIGNNKLLACTNNGLNIINTRTLAVTNHFFTAPDPSDKANLVISTLKDVDGNIIVATYKYIFKLNPDFKVLDSISCGDNFIKAYGRAGTFPYLFCYEKTKKWAVFFRNMRSFFTVDFKHRKIEKESSLPELPDNENLASVSSDIEHNILLIGERISVKELSTSTLLMYKNETGKTEKRELQFPLYSNLFSNGAFLNDSILVINRFFGSPYQYNIRSNQLTEDKETFNWFTSDPDGIGCSLYNDGKYLWAGTSKELLKISSAPLAFTRLKEVDSLLKNPSLVQINNLFKRDNTYYITGMGLGYVSYNTISATAQTNHVWPTGNGGVSVSDFTWPVDKNNIWLCSYYGLRNYNTTTHQYSLVHNETKPSDLDTSISTSCTSVDGNLWMASRKFLVQYLPSEKRFIAYPKGKEIPDGYISDMASGPDGNMYFAFQDTNALIKWEKSTGKFTQLAKEFIYKDYHLDHINAMCCDHHNGLYLSGKGSFIYYNLTNGKYDVYFKNDGLSTTRIRDICVDNNGLTWIATANGLNCFNPVLKKFTAYYKDDGLPDDNLYGVGIADSATNTLWIGTSKEFRLFEPNKLLGENKAPRILLTGFRINGDDNYIDRDLSSLPYTQNNINIDFTGINFDNGNLNIYEYKLEGWDEHWKNSNGEKFATYTNLPSGEYVFKVKAANRQGVWTDNPAEIKFKIRPPFWKTWWFYLLFVLFIFAGLTYIFRLQAKRGRTSESERLKINDEINELRMRALRSQLNPHFIFNALNSIQYFVMDNNTIEASKYLSKFAKLFRLVLDNSEASLVPLQKEIDLLTYYIELEALRFNNNFTYHFEVGDTLNKETDLMPPMMLQPHIENAILHGLSMKKTGGFIILRFKKTGSQTLQCEIEDNGMGRKAAAVIKQEKFKTHESKGLLIIEKRMELVSAQYNVKASYRIEDIYDSNGNAAGTRVTVILPLINNNKL
ncbi:MAG: histidine kinase [Ferruginibacter sp.]